MPLPLLMVGPQQQVSGSLVEARSFGLQGVHRVEHGGQWFEVNPDEAHRLLENPPVFGKHQRHGITPVPDLLVGQYRLILVDDALPVGAGNMLCGQDRHDARQGLGGGRVDASIRPWGMPARFTPAQRR